MMPSGTSATPPADSRPAYESGRQPGGAGTASQGVIELRKALGLPPDQPIPEETLLQAASGRRGPQIQQLAQRIGAGGTFKPDPHNPPGDNDADDQGAGSPNGVPSAPDAGQPGGQAMPPNPKGPDLANGPNIMPGNNPAKIGSRTIFGRPSVNAIGEQGPEQKGTPQDDVDEPNGAPLRASHMFRRR